MGSGGVFSGDAGGNNNIKFRTNGIERMFISASGGQSLTKIGIGTTTPSNPLHINSSEKSLLLLESSDGLAHIAFKDDLTTDANKVRVGAAANELQFIAGGTEAIRIKSNNNVGIGTTAASAKLHVSGTNLGLIVDNATNTLGDGVELARFLHRDGTNNPRLAVRSTNNGVMLQSAFTTGINGEFRLQSRGGSSYMAFDTGS